jgi:ornithine cyclodeaminase/alanine dehydrogenase-like protein (mu-crystallin family)
MAEAAVVVDVLAQSIVMGDMHHAVKAGVMKPSDVRAEIGRAHFTGATRTFARR